MALSKLLDHLEKNPCSSNTEPMIVTGSSGFENFNLSILGRLKNPQISWKVTTYCFDGHFFVLKVNKSGDYWRFIIIMFETPEVCSEFNIWTEVYEVLLQIREPVSRFVACLVLLITLQLRWKALVCMFLIDSWRRWCLKRIASDSLFPSRSCSRLWWIVKS